MVGSAVAAALAAIFVILCLAADEHAPFDPMLPVELLSGCAAVLWLRSFARTARAGWELGRTLQALSGPRSQHGVSSVRSGAATGVPSPSGSSDPACTWAPPLRRS